MWAQGAGPVNLVLVSRMQHLYLLEDMDDPFKKVFFLPIQSVSSLLLFSLVLFSMIRHSSHMR